MRAIDELYLKWPFYGSRRLCKEIRQRGYSVNRKRVQRWIRQMSLRVVYPKPRTSQPGQGHKIYPYLLKGLTIDRPNQVWASDICYVPMAKGFMYLTIILDWYSRRVLAGRISNSLEAAPCIEALEKALRHDGALEICNTNQGTQFTSEPFSRRCSGRITATAVWTEKGGGATLSFHLWRSVKYKDIYLRAYETPAALGLGLTHYFQFRNTERRHQALNRRTPDAVYGANLEAEKAS